MSHDFKQQEEKRTIHIIYIYIPECQKLYSYRRFCNKITKASVHLNFATKPITQRVLNLAYSIRQKPRCHGTLPTIY